MNAIQKAAFAASSLAITLVGAALVTAPMAFARALPIVAHADCSAASLQVTLTQQGECNGLGLHSGLIALNRR